MKNKSIRSTFIVLMLASVACGGTGVPATSTPACAATQPTVQVEAESRSFRMGFTRWPPEATIEGIQHMNAFIASHADLTAIHFDGGIPWPEAFVDGNYPAHVMSEWQSAKDAIPEDHRIYVAITPLNMERKEMASYWGTSTGQPLSAPWNEYTLNHPDVKMSYLNYAKRVVDFFEPDYFAIGIEVNVAQANAPETWRAYKELHRHVYEALKKEYPDLPIFATFTNTHMNGLDGGDKVKQQVEITQLLPYSDLLGLSVYPYGWSFGEGNTNGIKDDIFDTALSFGKAVVIAESGMPSAGFSAFGLDFEFTPEDQEQWIQLLLTKAEEHRFLFVINWASIDFDKLLKIFPDQNTRELATFWVYTGLQRSDGCDKKALATWDAYLRLPTE